MNFASKTLQSTAIDVGITDDPATLSTFLNPECAAAIWRRETPTKVQSWLDDVDADALPRGRVILPPQAIGQTVRYLFDMVDLPAGPERDWLQQDILGLADMFSILTQAKYLRLRLDVVTTNACRKFHIDAISARLVCTYRGAGTQYGISTDGGEPKRVFTVQTGSPILLRGSLWPAVPSSNLLHRSPPIEGTGETRLVLVLDPVTDPEGDK